MIFYKNDVGGFIGFEDAGSIVLQLNLDGDSVMLVSNKYASTEDGVTTYNMLKQNLSALPEASVEEKAQIQATLDTVAGHTVA